MTSQRLSDASTVAVIIILAVVVYVVIAYVILPAMWSRYERQPGLAHRPMVTATAAGIPGDPLNVGLVGSAGTISAAFKRAGWTIAAPITIETAARIAESVVLGRPDRNAPVSALYYDGRKENLAFELDVGGSADKRHHVRLWRVLDAGAEGPPVWLGAASFDTGAGLSRLTGQITHHIAPDVDAERAFVMSALTDAGAVSAIYTLPGVGATEEGRNGEGDRYVTDGDIAVAVLRDAE